MPKRNRRTIGAEDLYRFRLATDGEISPDGRHVVSCIRHVNEDDKRKITNLWIVPTDGGEPYHFTHGDHVDSRSRWSSDGTKIAYSKKGDIFVVNADGSGQTKLTDHPAADLAPSWSPDGSKIVFRTDRDGNYEIYVMNPDGSNQMNLTNSVGHEWGPTWAP